MAPPAEWVMVYFSGSPRLRWADLDKPETSQKSILGKWALCYSTRLTYTQNIESTQDLSGYPQVIKLSLPAAACSDAVLCPKPLWQTTSLFPMRSNPFATNPVSLRSCYHATILTSLCWHWRTLKAQASLSFALPPFEHSYAHNNCVPLTLSPCTQPPLHYEQSCDCFYWAVPICQCAPFPRCAACAHLLLCLSRAPLAASCTTRAPPHSSAALSSYSFSDVPVLGRCYFFWRSQRATIFEANNCVATSCCR